MRTTVTSMCFLFLSVAAVAPQASTNHDDTFCNPPDSFRLDVTLHPQETSMWCWAASGEMVMKTVVPRTVVDQCDEANKRFGFDSCCNHPVPANCVQGGWPEFGKYNFTSTIKNGPLSFDEIKQEIFCNHRPVAFSWHWLGRGGHMMVAVGYQIVNGTRYVIKDDPWPPNEGQDQVAITYDSYVSGADHTHWDDYYKVVHQ